MSKKPATQPAAPPDAPAKPTISFAPTKPAFEGPVTYPPGGGAYIRTKAGDVIPDPSEQPRAPAAETGVAALQKETDE